MRRYKVFYNRKTKKYLLRDQLTGVIVNNFSRRQDAISAMATRNKRASKK